jgi:hypothetical protein
MDRFDVSQNLAMRRAYDQKNDVKRVNWQGELWRDCEKCRVGSGEGSINENNNLNSAGPARVALSVPGHVGTLSRLSRLSRLTR